MRSGYGLQKPVTLSVDGAGYGRRLHEIERVAIGIINVVMLGR